MHWLSRKNNSGARVLIQEITDPATPHLLSGPNAV
jgi:hypothetical protein